MKAPDPKASRVFGYTDYPVFELGDQRGRRKYPIRRVRIHGWDGNKYACVTVKGMTHAVTLKRFYLYTAPGRLDSVPVVPLANLRELSDEDINTLCGPNHDGFSPHI